MMIIHTSIVVIIYIYHLQIQIQCLNVSNLSSLNLTLSNQRQSYLPINKPLYIYTPDNVAQKIYRKMYYKIHGKTDSLSKIRSTIKPIFIFKASTPTIPIAHTASSSLTSSSSSSTSSSSSSSSPSSLSSLASALSSSETSSSVNLLQIEDKSNKFKNSSGLSLRKDPYIWNQIYSTAGSEDDRKEQLKQMNAWLNEDPITPDNRVHLKADINRKNFLQKNKHSSNNNLDTILPLNMSTAQHLIAAKYSADYDDGTNYEPSGTPKTPPCAHSGRYYCSFKEDYPKKVVTEVTRYYKWPLEKLFRDLRNQIMPKLASDNFGSLVCDSVTRIVRPGWARNTNNHWLVVINNSQYSQYVTEVICRHGSGSYCNFIPPCYHSTCKQRYNTQKLLVIDPWNPYKGPFLSEFLFPSCCVCYVPDEKKKII